jgi:hypothetical protein
VSCKNVQALSQIVVWGGNGENTCLPWESKLVQLSLLTYHQVERKTSETNRTRKSAGFFKGKLYSLSRAPTPSSIEMDSGSDNRTR